MLNKLYKMKPIRLTGMTKCISDSILQCLHVKPDVSEALIIHGVLRCSSLRSLNIVAEAYKHHRIRKGIFKWYLVKQQETRLFLRVYAS